MKKMYRQRSRNENETNSTELEHFGRERRSRGGNYSWNEDIEEELHQQPPKEQYLEKQLEPGDTLQTLSIQFNCPISELKRINNIHRDNEVFARRIIKVPVRYYSLLSEKLVGVHRSSALTENTLSNALSKSHSDFLKCDTREDNINLDNSFITFLSKENSVHLTTSSTLPQDVDEEETINDSSVLLPNDHVDDQIITRPEVSLVNDVFQCSGSDWGLSWLQLLTFTLLLLLGGPILYLLYHAESDGATKALHGSELGNNDKPPLRT